MITTDINADDTFVTAAVTSADTDTSNTTTTTTSATAYHLVFLSPTEELDSCMEPIRSYIRLFFRCWR